MQRGREPHLPGRLPGNQAEGYAANAGAVLAPPASAPIRDPGTGRGIHWDPGNGSSNSSRLRGVGPAGGYVFFSERSAPKNEEAERKALEGIMTELRREVDKLDEDAWMFKKVPP
eukprot:TRINITY_DN14441_c0_g1_i1.p1 TRINITY_DN14441_c0_g1~~TRINITY_DN14441_c0_g1_i1.p1  ORF type:complete len:115 (+),score=23.86 TRINITY_DN14441_c0_g1_i1:37-381(+)